MFLINIFVWAAVLAASSWQLFPGALPDEGDYRHLYPIVGVEIRVHEDFASHMLPYVLGTLETWRYPKDRMHVAFFIDPNTPNSNDLISDLKSWCIALAPKLFRSAIIHELANAAASNWREEALGAARHRGCAFALIADTDTLLVENSVRHLVALLLNANSTTQLPAAIVAPLLNAPFGAHSNVHALMDDEFVSRKKVGSQRVYYANGPLLFNLKHKDSSYLSFDENNLRDYHGNGHPIDILAFSAYSMNIPIVVDNSHFYGYFIDSRLHSNPQKHRRVMNTFLANLVSDRGPMSFPQSVIVERRPVEPTRFGFDAIFLINLARRPERLQKMSVILRTLGVDFEVFEAVDGSALTDDELAEFQFLPGYQDPYHQRPMKRGEIGCFLSHFEIWQRVVAQGLEKVLILEDDIRFTENGLEILAATTEDLMKTRVEWDFIYLGRKKMRAHGDEFFVSGHRYLSTVGYSYWTLGYAITNHGAQKLLDAEPLKKLMALDEFLPILYGKHPNKQWTEAFALSENDTLRAFTTYPLVVEPERYTYQPGYVSDTEDSAIVEPNAADDLGNGNENKNITLLATSSATYQTADGSEDLAGSAARFMADEQPLGPLSTPTAHAHRRGKDEF